jgi:hypothetical protein
MVGGQHRHPAQGHKGFFHSHSMTTNMPQSLPSHSDVIWSCMAAYIFVSPADIDFADDADAMEVAAALAAAKRAAAAAAAGRNPGHDTSAVGAARGGAHGGGGGGGRPAAGTDAFLSAMLKAEQAHERKAAAGGAQGGGDELQRLMAQKGKTSQVSTCAFTASLYVYVR